MMVDENSDVSTPDPAAEIVSLAAKLLRLQSRLGTDWVANARTAGPAVPGAPPLATAARYAASRSGIEVLRGVAVSLVGEIQASIERDAFYYLYQPIASVATGAIAGVEALLRWRRGVEEVTPPLFLPIAEETRMLCRIQARLLDDVARILPGLVPGSVVAISCPLTQLTDSQAVMALIERIAQLGIDASRLIIQINQQSAPFEASAAYASIRHLKQAGIGIALDGFGSAVASWSPLSCLPVDLIKIDGSLIGRLEHSRRAATIVEGIIGMAHRLGHRVVAGGVETAQQLAMLATLGCDLAQGGAVGEAVRDPLPPHAAHSAPQAASP